MIHAIECKHFTNGLFQIDILDNKVLLWCAGLLLLSTVRIRSSTSISLAKLILSVPRRPHPRHQPQGFPRQRSRMGMGNRIRHDFGLPRIHRSLEMGQASLLPKKGSQAARKLAPYRQDSSNGADGRTEGLGCSLYGNCQREKGLRRSVVRPRS
jgi:hypothetical protein